MSSIDSKCKKCGHKFRAGETVFNISSDPLGRICSRCPIISTTNEQPIGKPSNPKDALGIKKAPLSTLPTQVSHEAALAMLEGARKYGRHNYRVIGVRASTYYDAALRHICAWWEGEDIDPDSGLPHIVKAIACLYVLRDSQLMGMCEDDRPPEHQTRLNIDRLNKLAEGIIERYPECHEPYTEKLHGTKPGYGGDVDRTKPIEGGY